MVGFGAPPLRGLLGVLLVLAPWTENTIHPTTINIAKGSFLVVSLDTLFGHNCFWKVTITISFLFQNDGQVQVFQNHGVMQSWAPKWAQLGNRFGLGMTMDHSERAFSSLPVDVFKAPLVRPKMGAP